MKWTEDAMLRHLWRHFVAQSWAGVPQVTVALRDLDPEWFHLSGYAYRQQMFSDARTEDAQSDLGGVLAEVMEQDTDRRIDMLLARPGRKEALKDALETLAIEVKVSRADFLSDRRNPAKQAPWKAATTRFAYAVPKGLVQPEEVGDDAGLLYVTELPHGWGEVEWAKRAPYREGHAPELPRRVLVSLLHRIGQLEAHTRAWNTTPAAAGTEQEVRAALAAANKVAEKAKAALDRTEGAKEAWKAAYVMLAKNGHPCHWCGQPVKPLSPQNGWFKKWRHIDAGHDEPCKLLEAAAVEAHARTEYAAADEPERVRRLTSAHRRSLSGFDADAEAEPWRAFIPWDRTRNAVALSGVQPADVLPPVAE